MLHTARRLLTVSILYHVSPLIASALWELFHRISLYGSDQPPYKPKRRENCKMNQTELQKKDAPIQGVQLILSRSENVFINGEFFDYIDVYDDVVDGKAVPVVSITMLFGRAYLLAVRLQQRGDLFPIEKYIAVDSIDSIAYPGKDE